MTGSNRFSINDFTFQQHRVELRGTNYFVRGYLSQENSHDSYNAKGLGQLDLGATDLEIHDTVLIAATFCMFNRYVDGLGTWAPQDREFYVQRAEEGYANYDVHK